MYALFKMAVVIGYVQKSSLGIGAVSKATVLTLNFSSPTERSP